MLSDMQSAARCGARQASRPRHVVAVLLVAVLLANGVRTVMGTEPTCSASDNSCRACRGSKNDQVNFMNNLPRFDRQGQTVASNLASYEIFVCAAGTGGPGEAACSVEPAEGDAVMDDLNNGGAPESSPARYAEGVALYVGAAALMFALSILFAMLFMFCRYCCCCPNRCTGGCGSRYPQPASKPGCMRCGFDKHTRRYPCGSRTLTRACMLIFVAAVATGVGLGYRGVLTMKDALAGASRAPDPAADMVLQLLQPAQHTFAHLVGGSIVGTVAAVRGVVLSAVDLTAAKDDIACTRDVIKDAPSMQPVLAFLDDVQAVLDSLPDSARTNAALHALNASVHALPSRLDALSQTLQHYDDALAPLRTTAVAEDIIRLNTSITALRPFPTSVIRDFGYMGRYAPTPATLVGPSSLASRLQALPDDGCASCTGDHGMAYRQELKDDLADLAANLTHLPNVTEFAGTLEALNSTIDSVQVSVEAVIVALQAIQDTVEALPSSSSLVDQLRGVQAMLHAIDLDEVLLILRQMNSTINMMPDVDTLRPVLQQIRGVQRAVPCILRMVAQVRSINATLVRLPSSMDSAIESAADINSTVSDALQHVNDVESSLDDADEMIESLPDMSDTYEDVRRMQSEMRKMDTELNITKLILSVEDAGADTNISFASLLDRTRSILTTLRDPDSRPSAAMVASLRSMDAELTLLPSLLDASTAAIELWERGWCVANPSQSCLCDDVSTCFSTGTPGPSTDCSGGMCDMSGAARAPGVCVDDPARNCTSASDCPTGACTQPDVSALVQVMQTLAADLADLPDSGDIVGNLETVRADMDALPNLDDKVAEVERMQDSVHALPNITDYVVQLQEVQARLHDVPDTEALVQDWQGVEGSLDDIADLMSVRDAVSSFDDALDSVRDGPLDDAVDYAGRAETFFHHNLTDFLGRLSTSRLLTLMEAGGMAAGVEEVLRVAEDSYDALMRSDAKLTGPDGPLHSTLDQLRRAQDTEARAQGSIYYFLRLANKSMPLSTDEADRLDKNAEGVEWRELYPHADVQLCVTEQCISNTLDELFERSVEDSSEGAVPVPVPAHLLLMLPYALPALVALLGLLGMVCVKCQRTNPAICVTCCSFLMMPCIFLLVGVLLFPLVMVLSDVCASGEAVGRQYVTLAWPAMCSDSLKGVMVPGTEDCRLEVAGTNITVSPAVYDELLLGACPATGSLAGVLTAFADEFKNQPHDRVRDTLDDMRKDGDFYLRPTLRDPIVDGAAGLGPFVQYIAGNVSEVVSCGGLHGVFLGFKKPLCCDAMTSMFWVVFSWYLIGLAMFFCGCCAGILGNKRFPSRVWGPHLNRVQQDPAALEYEQLATKTGTPPDQMLWQAR